MLTVPASNPCMHTLPTCTSDLYILRYQASAGALGASQAITLPDKPWLLIKLMVHEAAVLWYLFFEYEAGLTV